MPIVLNREACRDYARSSRLEWIETNGTGAFAMGSVSGANTRRYHALLVASLRPPVERNVLLSRFEEEVEIDGSWHALSACQYPGVVAPSGYENLVEFRIDPCATWVWEIAGVRVEKQVFLIDDRQAVVIRYHASRPCRLKVRPFLAFRDYHSLAHDNGSWRRETGQARGTLAWQPYESLPKLYLHHPGTYYEDGHWYGNVEYLAELDRGLDFREDVYSPGVIECEMPAAFCATLDPETHANGAEPRRKSSCAIEAAADQFRARRADGEPTIIAGYPWFTDWGRDTMISLPGLLIARGLLDEARRIIEGFLAHMDRGIIPNRFPDAGENPEYNTVDATLWMFIAVQAYLDAGGDRWFLTDVFYPRAVEILEWHRRGTWYGIGVDPEDGLLRAGSPGTQLTWMDAKIGDWVVTPRHGKPVEINALWFNALSLMAGWAPNASERRAFEAEAERVKQSFRARFWNADRGCLYDVIQDGVPVDKLRPNQLLAASLPYPLLSRAEMQSMLRVIEAELLTPVGLRTLDRSDPDYKPRYRGGPFERDSSYHQGTVWPWLLGLYVDAYLAAFGKSAENLTHCRGLVNRLEMEMTTCGLGSIAEVYDAEAPHTPGGCPAQAWSVAEIIRVKRAYVL